MVSARSIAASVHNRRLRPAHSRLWPALILQLVVLGSVPADEALPTTEQVVDRMLEANRARGSKLRDYTSIRHYSLQNKRVGTHAAMTVRVTYRFPGYKDFEVLEESGPAAVRKRVFKRMLDSEMHASSRDDLRDATQITPQNYAFRLVNAAAVDGRRCFVLDAEPKTKNPLLFKGRIWVDAEEYAVTRIEGAPAQNPSFWLRKTSLLHHYGKFGPFWLAVSNHSESDVLIFGRTEVQIEYSDYKINQEGICKLRLPVEDLPDSHFVPAGVYKTRRQKSGARSQNEHPAKRQVSRKDFRRAV